MMIILSEYDESKLGTANEILRSSDDKRIAFLSDALYLIFSKNVDDTVEDMLAVGAEFFVLDVDVSKRGLMPPTRPVHVISYEELVKQILAQGGGLVNL